MCERKEGEKRGKDGERRENTPAKQREGRGTSSRRFRGQRGTLGITHSVRAPEAWGRTFEESDRGSGRVRWCTHMRLLEMCSALCRTQQRKTEDRVWAELRALFCPPGSSCPCPSLSDRKESVFSAIEPRLTTSLLSAVTPEVANGSREVNKKRGRNLLLAADKREKRQSGGEGCPVSLERRVGELRGGLTRIGGTLFRVTARRKGRQTRTAAGPSIHTRAQQAHRTQKIQGRSWRRGARIEGRSASLHHRAAAAKAGTHAPRCTGKVPSRRAAQMRCLTQTHTHKKMRVLVLTWLVRESEGFQDPSTHARPHFLRFPCLARKERGRFGFNQDLH